MFAACAELPGALTAPALGFPTDVLEDFGVFFPAQVYGSAALGGRAGGPGPCDQGAAGLGGPRLGNGTLAAALGAGVFCGQQAQELPECSGALEPGQGAHLGHHGHGCGALHATQSLERLDHRRQAPRCALGVACVVEPLAAFGVCGNRPDVFWKDDVLRWGGQTTSESPRRGAGPQGARPG